MSQPQSNSILALLFDIGGVCVLSPFQAILDYEIQNNIPRGWINKAISASKPNGAWQRLERGELKLDADFFNEFRTDLHNVSLWNDHLKSANANIASGQQDSHSIPLVDVEWLIDAILRASSQPDPYMYPALRKLKASGRFLMAALSNTMPLPDDHPANRHSDKGDIRSIFDPFVSSAHYGVRKPEPRAYELAMQLMKAKWKQEARRGELRPENVVFLDDIGENLRQGKAYGFNTVKVVLGDTRKAVRDLEAITGMSLLENGAKL